MLMTHSCWPLSPGHQATAAGFRLITAAAAAHTRVNVSTMCRSFDSEAAKVCSTQCNAGNRVRQCRYRVNDSGKTTYWCGDPTLACMGAWSCLPARHKYAWKASVNCSIMQPQPHLGRAAHKEGIHLAILHTDTGQVVEGLHSTTQHAP
jgi:hypothetical protein